MQKFGSSREIVKSAADALEGKTYSANYSNPSSFLEAAIQVSACGYEFGTAWGKQVILNKNINILQIIILKSQAGDSLVNKKIT